MRFSDLVHQKLDEFDEASPVGKILIIIQLRTMFNQHTIEEGIEAINDIMDERRLRVLLGVGMKGVLYYKLAARRGDIMGL